MSAPSNEIVEPAALLLLLRQTRSLLACHQALGLTVYPASAELLQLAKRLGLAALPPSPPARDASSAAVESRRPAETAVVPPAAAQMTECKDCPWASAAPVPAPDVLLTVVCDCLDAKANGSLIWSPQEDQLFWKMLAAIALGPSDVHVVRLVKCVRPGSSGPCLARLDQELRTGAALLICAMGFAAARVLTGQSIPLARLRNRLHGCRRKSALQAMVLPTYHPSFLIEHPDMKPAAWKDLLLLKGALATQAKKKQAAG